MARGGSKHIIRAMPELFHKLIGNVIAIFRGRNLLVHAAAIFLTILIVETGLDWTYYRWTRVEIFAQLALPAIMLGSLVPILGCLVGRVVGASFRANIVGSPQPGLAGSRPVEPGKP